MSRFKSFSNRIAKILNRIANRITLVQIDRIFMAQIELLNRFNYDLNPNRDWDLPITVRWLQLRFDDFDSTAIRSFCDHSTTYVTTVGLPVCGLLHCGLSK